MGYTLIVLGVLLRVLALRQLNVSGFHYIKPPARLWKDGLYSQIRNPMYLGSLIMFLGICAVAFETPAQVLALMTLAVNFILQRIFMEEQVLFRTFGHEYLEYISKTKRLIPFIW